MSNKRVTGNSIVTISFQLPKQFRNSRKLSKVIPSKATKKSTKELCTENSCKVFVENSQWGQSNYEVALCSLQANMIFILAILILWYTKDVSIGMFLIDAHGLQTHDD